MKQHIMELHHVVYDEDPDWLELMVEDEKNKYYQSQVTPHKKKVKRYILHNYSKKKYINKTQLKFTMITRREKKHCPTAANQIALPVINQPITRSMRNNVFLLTRASRFYIFKSNLKNRTH